MTCDIELPEESSWRWWSCINSQSAGSAPGWSTGILRRSCQSSLSPRSTAASVSSRPRLSRTALALNAPFCSSVFHTSATSGETLWPPLVCGTCFHSRSPRRATRNGRISVVVTKSGCSPTPPRRLSPTTLPVAISLTRSWVACSIAGRGGVGLVSPRQASTNEGAGAGNCDRRGRKGHKG